MSLLYLSLMCVFTVGLRRLCPAVAGRFRVTFHVQFVQLYVSLWMYISFVYLRNVRHRMTVSSYISSSVIGLIICQHVSFVCLFDLYFYCGTRKTVSCRCMTVLSDVLCSVIKLIICKQFSFVCLFDLYFYRGTRKTVSYSCRTVSSDISCPVVRLVILMEISFVSLHGYRSLLYRYTSLFCK